MSNFTLLNASAGSGKTQRITLEFLKIVLFAPTEIPRILSITFTNKAAGEMKERLIRALSELALDAKSSKMLPDLKKHFKTYSEEEIQKQAADTLKYILHNYSDLYISTIDSFMQRIIRSFAHELYLPANYEVSIDNDELNELVVSNIIDKANSDKNITKILKNIIRMQIEDEKSPLLLSDNLLNLINHLTEEASIEIVNSALELGTENLIASFDKLLAKIRLLNKDIHSKLALIDEVLEKNNLSNDDFVKKGNATTIFNYIKNLKVSLDARPLSDRMLELLKNAEFLNVKNPEVENEISSILLDCIDKISELKYGKLIAKGFPIVALLSDIWKLREDFKTENNILPVSDFNRIIREVLMNEPVPFIYVRAGSRFKTIMIDEFQDTSLMQWKNLLPLIHESISNNNSSWLVGDPKQSIYRWRNGNVEIMLNLPKLYDKTDNDSDVERILEKNFNHENLEFNYRSKKNIVEFNSSFYTAIKNWNDDETQKDDIYSNVYNSVKQIPFKKAEGYVECRIYNDKITKLEEAWLGDIYNLINKCVENGYSFNDIAILTRQNYVGTKISSYLMSQNEPIPVVSRETLQFATSLYCKLVMCVYRLIHCPTDDLNAVETYLLLSKCANINLDVLPNFDDFIAIKNSERGKVLLEKLVELNADFSKENINLLAPSDEIDLIIQFLDISNEGGFFLLFLREKIMKMQDKIGFLHNDIWGWWLKDGLKTSVIVPETANAVNVMTIHSSKGLQFPIVIIPYFNINEVNNISKSKFWHIVDKEKWDIPYSIINYSKNNSSKIIEDLYNVESSKSRMDTINLMYVATTRAEEKLFVFSFANKKLDKGKSLASNDSEIMLYNFLKSEKLDFSLEESADYQKYTLGDFSEKTLEKQSAENSISIKNFTINPNKPLRTLRKKVEYDSAIIRESAMEGKIIHEIISQINDKNDVEQVVNFSVNSGYIHQSQKENYVKFFNYLIDNFSFAFPGKNFVLNEREIVDTQNLLLRPDRMIFDAENKYKIIDFKTGRQLNEHKQQVLEYVEMLSKAGIQVESAHVFYININEFSASVVDVM